MERLKQPWTDALSVWHSLNNSIMMDIHTPMDSRVRPGAREESAALLWLTAPSNNTYDLLMPCGGLCP